MLTPQKKKAKRGLALISLIAAVVIWFIVGAFINPIDTRYISGVSVQIHDSSVLNALGLSVVEGGEQTVTVKVSGPKLSISALTAADFTAIPKYAGISDPGLYTLDIDIAMSSNASGITIEEYSPGEVAVRLARLSEITLDVEYVVETDVPEGRVLGNVVLEDKSVTVTGEQSVLETISSAKVSISSFDSTVQTLPIVLFDDEGHVINDSSLILSVSQTQVTATLNYMKEIALVATVKDADRYHLGSSVNRTVTPSVITVVGSKDALDSLTSCVVDSVFMWEINGDSTKTVPLVLPSGVTTLNGQDAVTVATDINDCTQRKFDVSNFRLDNSLNGMDITVTTEKLSSVTVMGPSDIIEALSDESLIATVIPTAGQTPPVGGSVAMSVIITTAEGKVWAVGEYKVYVTVG